MTVMKSGMLYLYQNEVVAESYITVCFLFICSSSKSEQYDCLEVIKMCSQRR